MSVELGRKLGPLLVMEFLVKRKLVSRMDCEGRNIDINEDIQVIGALYQDIWLDACMHACMQNSDSWSKGERINCGLPRNYICYLCRNCHLCRDEAETTDLRLT